MKKSELFVVTKAKDLANYILTVTEKSPKKFRFTLVVRIQNYILDAIEKIFLANTTQLGEQRIVLQEDAKKLLSMLGYFAGLAYEQGCILFHQFENISKGVATVIMYLNKWIKSDIKRKVSKSNS